MVFEFYQRNWKIWICIPIILLVLSIGMLTYNKITTGEFFEKDIELSGGKMITVEVSNANLGMIKQKFGYADIHMTTGFTTSGEKITTLIIEIPSEMNEDKVLKELSDMVNIEGEASVKNVGPVLSDMFWRQAVFAIIFAFILMIIIVFILFRSFVPSSAIVLSVIIDIGVTAGMMNVIGIKISLAVFAAFLMLIGYSVDTDILLTTRLTKLREKEIPERIKAAMKTGLTMTITSLVAFFTMYFISNAVVIQEIAIVLITGLCIDIISTWFTNAGILRWWIKRRESR